MDRREFLAFSVALGTAFAAARANGTAASQAFTLSAARRKCLDALVARIIPATDTPGALQAGVPQFIEFVLGSSWTATQRDRFLAGLDELERLSVSRHQLPFAELGAAQQDALLGELESAALKQLPDRSAFFMAAKDLTLVGYYTSEAGATAETNYLPAPGWSEACTEMKEGERAYFYGTPLDSLV